MIMKAKYVLAQEGVPHAFAENPGISSQVSSHGNKLKYSKQGRKQ